MIRAAWDQANVEGLPLKDLRFVADAYGQVMTVRIGDDTWQHDGIRFDPIEPVYSAEDDFSSRP